MRPNEGAATNRISVDSYILLGRILRCKFAAGKNIVLRLGVGRESLPSGCSKSGE